MGRFTKYKDKLKAKLTAGITRSIVSGGRVSYFLLRKFMKALMKDVKTVLEGYAEDLENHVGTDEDCNEKDLCASCPECRKHVKNINAKLKERFDAWGKILEEEGLK